MDRPAGPAKRLAVAFSEWLLILPPALLLAAAALRLLQPRQFQPARTSWAIFEWVTQHISHRGAALLVFWRENETLRQGMTGIMASVRRQFAFVILGTGTLLAGAILAAVLAHLITD